MIRQQIHFTKVPVVSKAEVSPDVYSPSPTLRGCAVTLLGSVLDGLQFLFKYTYQTL